ncbi:hypothetical protein EVA_02249 [gut metagenome]|uniref:Uncharacterized protein n=1 Tax=gut metagenome TaxID=749906 RepID=J9H6E3_9ZZZZ
MKKLKRFIVKSQSLLTKEEMALIQGGLSIDALDYCSPNDAGKTCVYAKHTIDGHQAYVLGECYIYTQKNEHGYIVTAYGCK